MPGSNDSLYIFNSYPLLYGSDGLNLKMGSPTGPISPLNDPRLSLLYKSNLFSVYVVL